RQSPEFRSVAEHRPGLGCSRHPIGGRLAQSTRHRLREMSFRPRSRARHLDRTRRRQSSLVQGSRRQRPLRKPTSLIFGTSPQWNKTRSDVYSGKFSVLRSKLSLLSVATNAKENANAMSTASARTADQSLTIRRAQPADVEVCGHICYNAFTTLNKHHNFPPDFPS